MGYKLEGHSEYMGICLCTFYAYDLDDIDTMILDAAHIEQADG